MHKKIVLIILLLTTTLFSKSQYYITAPGSTTPAGSIPSLELFTCEPSKKYNVSFDNYSPYTMTNITIVFNLPPGIVYDGNYLGAVTNGGFSTGVSAILASSTSSSVTITISSMGSQDKANIEFNLKADCGAFQHSKSGGSFAPVLTMTYTPSNTGTAQAQNIGLPEIIVRYPDLSVSAVYYANNTFAAPQYNISDPEVGDSIFRIIRIENGGEPLTSFTYKAKYSGCLDVFSHNLGAVSTQTSGGYTYKSVSLSGIDFTGIGNNDNIFDRNEILYLREVAVITCCNNPVTEHQVMWGCGSTICQLESTNIGITFPPSAPQLIASTQMIAAANDTLCYGDYNPIGIRLNIQNIGANALDSAQDITIQVYQGQNGFNSNYLSIIDFNSLSVTKAGLPIPYTLVSTSANNASFCSGPPLANPVGKFEIHIDKMYAGELVQLSWNIFTCNNTTCYGEELGFLGWRYSVNYSNRCNVAYSLQNKTGFPYKELEHGISPNGNNPGYTGGSQASTFRFTILESDFTIPRDASDYLKYEITIPTCMTFVATSANLFLRKWDGTILNPTSITVAGNVATATFQSGFYSIEQWELILNLTSKSCATAGCNTNQFEEITVQSYYKAKATCGFEHKLGCATARYKRNCQPCNEVLRLNELLFNGMRRVSTGFKDLNDDGIADAGNIKANPASDPIRTDRASYGDTVSAYFNIRSNPVLDTTQILCGFPIPAPPNYAYFYTKIKNGSLFSFLSIDLDIQHYINAPCSYTLNTTNFPNFPHTLYTYPAGPDSTVVFVEIDIRQQIANGNWPSYFLTAQAKLNFRINDNPSVEVTPCPYEFAFYPSNTQNTTFNANHPMLCNIYFGNIDVIGYRFTSYDYDFVDFHSCLTAQLNETYRFNMGEWFDDNVATNYYSKEFRHFAFVDTLIVTTNNIYSLSSAVINYTRTAGILNTASIPNTDLMPYLVSNTGNQFVFSVGDLFRNTTFPFGDEGFAGNVSIELDPSCFSLGMIDTVKYHWKYNIQPIIYNAPSTVPQVISKDNLEYSAPAIQIQSTNTVVPVTTTTFSWDVLLSNNSNVSNAENLWMALDNSTSSITILNVERVAGGPNFQPVGTSIPFGPFSPTGSLYRLRNLGGGKEIRLKIKAQINGCSLDSIRMILGYDCSGFPANLTSVTCPIIEYMMYAEPKFPNISVNTTASQNPSDLCDEVIYTFKVQNSRLGRAYNVVSDISLPIFLDYILGSAEIYDPANSGAGWNPIVPNINNGKLTFNISGALPTTVGANGLKGVDFPTENYVEIRLRVKTTCNFVSGSWIEFIGKANAACGQQFISQPLLTDPIYINGAIKTHDTRVIVDADYLTPCNKLTHVDISIVNEGPITSWTGDSITVVLPGGILYTPGTYVPGTNASVSNPSITNYGGKQYLKWSLNNLAINTDTAKFSFKIEAIPDSIANCQEKFMTVYTTNQDDVTCTSSGLPCNVNVITGDTVEPLFVEKANLNILAGSARSIPNPPNGETVIISLTIDNYGSTIQKFSNGVPNYTIVSFYEDIDASGTFTPADVLVTIDSLLDSIPNGSYYYHDSIDFPAGKACNFIAVIHDANNKCVCSLSEYLITNVKLDLNEPNDSVCANIPSQIGYFDSINGYTYSWSLVPAGPNYLNNSNSAAPTITAPNPVTGLYDSLTYEVTINRINCTAKDTIKVFITQSPIANAGIDDTICGDNYTLNGNIPLVIPGQVNSLGEWTLDPTFGNGALGATFADSSQYNTNVSNLVSGQYKFIWSIDNGYCIGQPDTVMITIYSTTYRLGNDTLLCNANTFTLNAPPLEPGFTGLWSFTAGSSTATITNGTLPNASLSGLSDGLYSLEWQVTAPGATCIYRDTIRIDVYQSDNPSAGVDSAICGILSFNLWANTLLYRNQGTWSVDSTTSIANNVTFSNVSNGQSNVSFTSPGVYDLIWRSSNTACSPLYDTLTITIGIQPNVNAGIDTTLCSVDTLVLNASALQVGEIGLWTLSASNPSVLTFDDATTSSTTVQNIGVGTYDIIWGVYNATCPIKYDTLTVRMDTLPIANAGNDSTLCLIPSIQLYASSITTNQTGSWKQIDANAPVTFVSNSPITNVNGLFAGTYEFEWSITNGICDTVKDTVIIEMKAPPTIFAGSDTSLCQQDTFNLNATSLLMDENGVWTADPSNPSIVAFDNTLLNSTTVRNLTLVGTYKLIWEVSNPYCTAIKDTIEIIVDTLPTANAGNDTILCETTIFQLYANTISPSQTGKWRQLDNNTPLTFMTPSSNSSFVSGLAIGNYQLEWVVTNGICDSVRDTLLIEIKEAPIANAGANQNLCLSNTASLSAIITTFQNYHNYEWKFDNIRSSYSTLPSITSPNNPTTTLTNLGVGVYYFVLKADNSYCDSVTDTIIIYNHGLPTIDFSVNNVQACADSCIEFSNLSSVNDSTSSYLTNYLWSFGDGSTSLSSNNAQNCYTDSGIYSVQLIVTTNQGCKDTLSKANYITIHPNPLAAFSFSPIAQIKPGDPITIRDLSVGSSAYQYNFGDDTTTYTIPNPQHEYNDTGYFIIKQVVSTDFGCVDSTTRLIYIQDELYIVIPNSFTPNGDGTNDVFIPIVLGIEPTSYQFEIYNRWGQLIYETSKQGEGWDGSFNDKMVQTGAYVWKIRFQKKSDKRIFERTGHLTLFK